MKNYVEEKRIRPDILTATVFGSIIIMMLYNIISVRIFGDKGSGFGAGPLALYFLLYVSFVFAVQKAVYIMVRLRARRSQFLNAQANMKKSIRIFLISGILIAIILSLSSFVIARSLFGSVRVYFQIIIVGVSLLFLCTQGVMRGYLQGLGYTKPIVLTDIFMALVAFVTGAIISGIMYSYGKKVNELFHGDEYSAIYGASGMMIGLLIGSIVGFIQIIVSISLRKKEIDEIVKGGAPRYLDNKNDVITGIRPILYLYASPLLMCLVDIVFYNVIQAKNGHIDIMVSAIGAYEGRIVSFVVILAFLCCFPFIKSWNRIMARIERDELEGARERLRKNIHFSTMLLFPVTVFLFTISDSIQIAVFGKISNEISGIFQLAAPLLFLLSIAIFSSWLLNHMGKNILLVVNLSLAWLIHILLLAVLVAGISLELTGIVISEIVALLVYDVLCLFMIFKMLKYKSNLLLNVGIPLMASAVSGLAAYFIDRIFVNLIGEVLTLIVGVVLYSIIYMLILIVLKGVKTHELSSIPFGKYFMGFSAMVQHDRE